MKRKTPSRDASHGASLSLPLEWPDAPPGTRSFLIVMEGLDAPSHPVRHRGLWDLMPDRITLPEGYGHGVKTEPLGYGINDFGHLRYEGPARPNGNRPHRYQFRIAALDVGTLLPIAKKTVANLMVADLMFADLWELAQSHILTGAALTGIYTGRRQSRAPPDVNEDS
jgi:Raf kinase inhibitor-like YbhB/YbcL family protein